MTIDPLYYPLLIALCTAGLLPLAVWTVRTLWGQWQENREQRLASAIDARLRGYVTTEALEMQLDTLQKHQDELHRQNKEAHERSVQLILADGHRREGMILGVLNTQAEERRADTRQTQEGIARVHERVDALYASTPQGDRRKS